MIAYSYVKSVRDVGRDMGFDPPDAALAQNVVDRMQSMLRTRGVAICISGMDGTGKTTAAKELLRLFDSSGVRARHLHLYQWHVNALITPVLLLHNRFVGRKVLVFDRTIYDNLAVAAIRPNHPAWLSRVALALVARCYPEFSYRFYLAAPLAELRRRRPDTTEAWFVAMDAAYEQVVCRARCEHVLSDSRLFGELLRNIARVD